MCINVLSTCVSMPAPETQQSQKRMVRFQGSEVTDGCEPPCGCWQLNPCSLEDQAVLHTESRFSCLLTKITSKVAFHKLLFPCLQRSEKSGTWLSKVPKRVIAHHPAIVCHQKASFIWAVDQGLFCGQGHFFKGESKISRETEVKQGPHKETP